MSSYDQTYNHILRRLEAMEARLEAAILRAAGLKGERVEPDRPENDPVRRIDLIETKLEALEEQLRRLEEEMRSKESPPQSFGSVNEFSTGHHFPGLG